MLGVGAKKKTYMDDVFSTFLYKGESTPKTVNTGIDMTDGGFAWVKNRSTGNHAIGTQELGSGYLTTNGTGALDAYGNGFNTFTSTGFTTTQGNQQPTNENGNEYVAWSWKKTPGFLDIVKYEGTGSAQSISHNLGSIPGMYIIKRTTGTGTDWQVFHRSFNDPDKAAQLNEIQAASSQSAYSNGVAPTSTTFTVNTHHTVNNDGDTYICYLFAGGESTASNARSLGFNGNGEYLEIADHADFDVGTNWTAECWFYADSIGGNNGIFSQWDSNGTNGYHLSYIGNNLYFYTASTNKVLGAPRYKRWHHVAISKEGSTTRIFLNGIQVVADFDMGTVSSTSVFRIGRTSSSGIDFNGQISNLRIVKGTAVYTSSFKVPTEPLTNITNTKLLCCNGSSQTSSTVTPGTIVQVGSGGAFADSPFDDPAGYVFGESGDQNIIKCGSYTTDSDEDATIELGWEPQWVMIKRDASIGTNNWFIVDSIRGFENAQELPPNNASIRQLAANTNEAESNSAKLGLISTGFHSDNNGANKDFIYMAIRRPDPLVQKPVELGTDVFAMDAGNGNTTQAFDSGFPVDFALIKEIAGSSSWEACGRLVQGQYLNTNTNSNMQNSPPFSFDSITGWLSSGSAYDSAYQSYMWKRGKGFDVVTYGGNGVNARPLVHNLNQSPQMIWIKNRTSANDWMVWHKDLTSGTHLVLNSNSGESTSNTPGLGTVSAISFNVGDFTAVNASNHNYIAMLFASVDGISKVGYFDGSSSEKTVTTGFTPRIIIIKKANGTGSWWVFDTLRNLGSSGNDKALFLESSVNQSALTANYINTTGTGFVMPGDVENDINYDSGKYIYYAHA